MYQYNLLGSIIKYTMGSCYSALDMIKMYTLISGGVSNTHPHVPQQLNKLLSRNICPAVYSNMMQGTDI